MTRDNRVKGLIGPHLAGTQSLTQGRRGINSALLRSKDLSTDYGV
jgi:hypothetical protein